MNDFFNFKRFGYYLRIEAEEKFKSILLITSVIILGLCAFKLPEMLVTKNFRIDTTSTLSLILFIGGTIVASKSFTNKRDLYNYLTLPVSTFEKLLSRFLFATLGFYIFTLLAVLIVSFIFFILSIIFYKDFYFNNPFNYNIINTTIYFLIYQIIYFTGSLFFKNNQWIKTSLFLLSLFIIVSIIGGIIFAKLIVFQLFNTDFDVTNFYNFENSNLNLLPNICKTVFLTIISPLLLFADYFKLKELKISDAV